MRHISQPRSQARREPRFRANAASVYAALLVSAAACSDSKRDSEAPTPSPLALEAREVLAAHHARGEFPGAVMALHDPALGDALVTTGSTAPGAAGTPLDPDVPWVIGSTTKTFVAVVALQLAQEGKLDLDASVEAYLPELPRASEITSRQLLQHTSGLGEYLESPVVLGDAQRHWTAEELIAVAVAGGPVAEPGAGHHYANTNYIALGEIIAQVSGMPWYEAVQQRILEPLGMRHTHYAGEEHAPPMGPGYALEDGSFVEFSQRVDASLGGAAGALQSTAPDLMRFAHALFEGRLFDAQRWTEMRAFVPGEPRGYVGHEYGLGFERYVVNELTLEGHAGSAPAHGSFVGIDPDSGLLVAVLINSSEPAPAPLMALEIAAAVAGKDVSAPPEADPAATTVD